MHLNCMFEIRLTIVYAMTSDKEVVVYLVGLKHKLLDELPQNGGMIILSTACLSLV